MQRGRFIVFEGLDGSGKTTAIESLVPFLNDAYITREPSDGHVGQLIRKALTKQITLHPETFALLFAGDRYEHIQNEILPMLEKGRDVLCDRYYFSNLAYQGDVVDAEKILNFNSLATDCIRPDYVFFVDTPPDECLRRIQQGRECTEHFEKLDNLTSLQKLYNEAFERLEEQENLIRIDGMQTPQAIVDAIYQHLK